MIGTADSHYDSKRLKEIEQSTGSEDEDFVILSRIEQDISIMTTVVADTNPLTDDTLAYGVGILVKRDSDLASIFKQFGPPPMWKREPGFSSLLYIILEQQVSLASARALYNRLNELVSPLTPKNFLEVHDTTLRAIGFSRQKIRYGRCLAEALLAGQLNLDTLGKLDDTTARAELMKIKGIGLWTANIYLLLALQRPDIWPGHDRALALAVQQVKLLATCPTPDELDVIGAAWKPWRSVAARLFWHDYLSKHHYEVKI